MKIFTIGLDAKPLTKNEINDSMTSLPTSVISSPSTITVERRQRNSFKFCMICTTCILFVLVLATAISEIAYNRIRDENFALLQWAERRQRLGYGRYCEECLNAQLIANSLHKQKRLEPISAVSLQEPASIESSTMQHSQNDLAKPVQTKGNPLNFLRNILEKIHEEAKKEGFDGTVHISILKMEPLDNAQASPFLDGFGEMKSLLNKADQTESNWPLNLAKTNDDYNFFKGKAINDHKSDQGSDAMNVDQRKEMIDPLINSVLGVFQNMDHFWMDGNQSPLAIPAPKHNDHIFPTDSNSPFHLLPFSSQPMTGFQQTFYPPMSLPLNERNNNWAAQQNFWPEIDNTHWPKIFRLAHEWDLQRISPEFAKSQNWYTDFGLNNNFFPQQKGENFQQRPPVPQQFPQPPPEFISHELPAQDNFRNDLQFPLRENTGLDFPSQWLYPDSTILNGPSSNQHNPMIHDLTKSEFPPIPVIPNENPMLKPPKVDQLHIETIRPTAIHEEETMEKEPISAENSNRASVSDEKNSSIEMEFGHVEHESPSEENFIHSSSDPHSNQSPPVLFQMDQPVEMTTQ